MSQTTALIAALKRQLKAHGKTYQDVSRALSLSEASVKRLFSEGNLSLPRLEAICDLISIDMSELVLSMAQEKQKLTQLSQEQEQEIADDLILLLIAICVVNGYSHKEITQQYDIEETVLIQKLVKLDRLKLIELLPGNKVKLRIAANFNWLPGGPIQQFFQQRIKEEFFSSRFNKSTEKLIVLNGLLSGGSNAELQKRMQKLASEFVVLKNDDAHLSMNDKHGTTLVVAVRQWHSSLFEGISKK